ncbi:hypothetical protein HQ560_11290, partial [bacterium]|nr:hypothetical protein [bacterium]
MRMKIRWKLLILFLIFALAPLLASFMVHRRSMRALAVDLGTSTRDTLVQNARRHLLSLVEGYARILRRDQKVLTYNILAQAREAELRLADAPPDFPTIFLAADYDAGEKLPTGMAASTQHFRLGRDGVRKPVEITYDEQVFYIPQGLALSAAVADMARLSTMRSVYKQLHTLNPSLLYWQYTSLESGLHSCYPGHGGYPPDYDPRKRPWYIDTKKTKG